MLPSFKLNFYMIGDGAVIIIINSLCLVIIDCAHVFAIYLLMGIISSQRITYSKIIRAFW